MAKKKKTRQEKIIADLRRQLDVTQRPKWEIRSEKLEPEVRKMEVEIKKTNLPLQDPVSHFQLLTSTAYLKRDLTKTLILAILALGLEFMIYFMAG